MRKRSIFLSLLFVLGAGLAVYANLDRGTVSPPAQPVAGSSTDGLSHAMTFTQPAEPAK